MPNTLSMWFDSFHEFSYKGGCDQTGTPKTIPMEDYVVPSTTFYASLSNFLKADCGKSFVDNLKVDGDIKTANFKITGWRQTIQVKKIDEVANQGVKYLTDMRVIEEKYALPNTYSFA